MYTCKKLMIKKKSLKIYKMNYKISNYIIINR